jgi:hypothetical protein
MKFCDEAHTDTGGTEETATAAEQASTETVTPGSQRFQWFKWMF